MSRPLISAVPAGLAVPALAFAGGAACVAAIWGLSAGSSSSRQSASAAAATSETATAAAAGDVGASAAETTPSSAAIPSSSVSTGTTATTTVDECLSPGPRSSAETAQLEAALSDAQEEIAGLMALLQERDAALSDRPSPAQLHALQSRVLELEAALALAQTATPTQLAEAASLAPKPLGTYPLADSEAVPSLPRSFFESDHSGVLFDLDGTLVESKEIWYALLAGCSLELGYGPLSHAVWEPTYGQSMESNRDLFFPNHSQEVIDAYCEEHYGEFVESHLRVLPGAKESLAAVRAALGGDVRRMALCTNCPLAITRQIIAHCPMLSEYFPESRLVCAGTSQLVDGQQLSAEEGQLRALELSNAERDAALGGSVFTTEGHGISYTLKAKPSADIIYAAAHRLGLRARDCLFVGDSKYDLMSALKAGCFALGIGEKGKGGHMHIDNIAQLADKMKKQ